MKKIIIMLLCCFFAMACFSGCNNNDTNSSAETGGEVNIENDFGLDKSVLPVASPTTYTGKVDIHLVFGDTLPAWQSVVNEYNKFQPKVRVTLTNHTSAEYGDLLRQEVSTDTDWDIFHGNYIGATVDRYAYDMYSDLSTKNYYSGGQIWRTVLESNAYTTGTTGRKITYIMNSESLLTSWFINEEAFKAAGIVDDNGAVKIPETWDELIEDCKKLKDAGYINPLGIAGNNDSITYSQFCWLLRVYGDQYYRDMLAKIQPVEGDYCYSTLGDPFVLDLNAEQPEAEDNYLVNVSRKYWTMLDETSADFCGPKSEKYGEFIGQLAKMQPYVSTTFATDSLESVRANFVANRSDKTSPVILLDYLGSGLEIENSMENAGERKFTLGMFDYPYMEGENVKTSFMRDVGGNGGYLSVMDHGNEQNAMTLDFIKFFMSPYGQSFYYDALLKTDATPDGISTVKGVAVPETWDSLFNNEKVTFTGLCDMNPYTSAMLWTVEGRATVTQIHAEYIRLIFSGEDTIDDFQNKWQNALFDEYQIYFGEMGYRLDCYKYPERNPI